MKKIIATVAMLAFAGLASAVTVTVEGQDVKGDNGAANSNAYKFAVNEQVTKSIAVDVSTTQSVTDGTNALSNRLEAGVTGFMPVGPFTAYTRVALGEKYTNGSNYGYYSVEPGVIYKVNDRLSVKAGYRFRDDVKTAVHDQTRTARIGVSYALTAKDTIGVRYDRLRGDSATHSYNFAYTRGF